jgi:hypothetical protein
VKRARKKTSGTGKARPDRVRSRVRRRPPADPVRQLDLKAFAAIGLASITDLSKVPPPQLAFHFGLVEHGVEVRLFVEGEYVTSVCRDFSGNHKVEQLKQSLYDKLVEAIMGWRKSL